MTKLKFISGAVMVLTIIALASGCTRKSASNSSVTLQMPSLKSQSVNSSTAAPTPILQNLIVNISGPGIGAPVFQQWSRKSSTDTPPDTMTLTVPQGSSRLVQVLGVVQMSDGSSMTFDYGDSTQDFSGPSVDVPVTLTPIGGSTGQGEIVGRYMTSSTAGPTGVVNFIFQPSGGKPQMIVHQGEIFNGWFDFFALTNGTGFQYVFEDGTPLFTSNASTTSALLSAPNISMFVSVPTIYKTYGGGTGIQQNSAASVIAGFFGASPSVTGKSICYNPNTVTLANAFTDSAATTSPLSWVGHSVSNATTQAGVIQGGSASCTGTEYSNYATFYEAQAPNGGEGMLNFKGPFKNLAASGSAQQQFLQGTYDGTNMNMSWSYVTSAKSGFDGVEVFYRTGVASTNNGNPDYKVDNGFACSRLVSDFGFTSAGKVLLSSGTPTSLSFPVAATAIAAGQFQSVVCPYRVNSPFVSFASNVFYFQTAIDYSTNSSGSASLYSLKLANVTTPTAGNTLSTSGCQQFTASLLDGTGTTGATAPTNLTFNVSYVNWPTSSPAPTSLGVYPDSTSCTGGGVGHTTTTLTFAAGSSTASFWISSASTGYAQLQIQGTNLATLVTDLAVAGASTPNALSAYSPVSAMIIGQCYPIYLRYELSSSPVVVSGLSTVTISSTFGEFHVSSSCADAATTSVSIGSSGSSTHGGTAYFKPTVATGTTLLTASASSILTSSPTFGPTQSLTFGTATPASLGMQVVGTGSAGSIIGTGCNLVLVSASNSAGAPIASPATPIGVTLNATGGNFYSNSTCTSGGAASIPYNLGSAGFTPVYFLSNASSMTISQTNDSSISPSTLNLTVKPASMIRWVGATQLMSEYCHSVQLQTVASDGSSAWVAPFDTPITFTFTGASGYSSLSSCQSGGTGMANVIVPAGASTTPAFFVRASASTTNINFSMLGGTPTTPIGGLGSTVSTAITKVSSALVGSCLVNTCTALTFLMTDASTNPQNPTDNISIALNAVSGGGTIYSDSGCTNSISNAVITPGLPSDTLIVYYKQPASGSFSVTGTVANFSNTFNTSSNNITTITNTCSP